VSIHLLPGSFLSITLFVVQNWNNSELKINDTKFKEKVMEQRQKLEAKIAKSWCLTRWTWSL